MLQNSGDTFVSIGVAFLLALAFLTFGNLFYKKCKPEKGKVQKYCNEKGKSSAMDLKCNFFLRLGLELYLELTLSAFIGVIYVSLRLMA